MPLTWPLTGRAEELRLATDLLQGPGRGVVLAGAAGVGKTRLTRELLTEVGRRGAVTRWTVATESARSVPLGALGLLTGAAEPIRQVEHAVEVLTAGEPDRLVIAVDDAHLLDPLSALVMQQLAVSGRARLVLTIRTGEPAPDTVAGLWKDGHLRRLELQPLSATESERLLEAVLGAPLDSTSSQRLWAASRGNPLYLRALVDGERAGGRLHRSAGLWQWQGQPELSPELSELIGLRLGDLSDAEQEAMDVVAFGEPLELPVLTGLTDGDALEVLEERGLVEVITAVDPPMVRMGHPLYGEARRARCGTVRGRRLRGRIVRALADSGERDVLRRGALALESDLPPDPELLTAAAQAAVALPEMLVAERLARAAVRAGAGFDAHLVLVSALVGVGHPAEDELAALRDQARTDAERVRAAVLWGMRLLINSEPKACAELLDTAESTVTGTGARAELHALRAAADVGLWHPRRAAERAQAALGAPSLSPGGIAVASWSQTMALGMIGRADELDAAARRGLAALERAPDVRWLVLPILGHQVAGLRLAGRLPEALEVATGFRAEHGDKPFGAEASSLLLGLIESSGGRLSSALRRLTEARAGLVSYPPTVWHSRCYVDLAHVHALLAEPAPARRLLEELDQHADHSIDFVRIERMLAEAWILAAEGVTSAAVTRAREAADEARRTGASAYEVLARHEAVGLGDRTQAARLAELADQVDGPLAGAAAAHAAALSADDGPGLLDASRTLERLGMKLRAADAAAHAAAALARHGRSGSAQLARAAATRLATECEGASTPALRELATPLPLTGREREIAALIAAGLSNREIADRLTVSVRTVEGHIYRACGRLGLAGRDELATVVG